MLNLEKAYVLHFVVNATIYRHLNEQTYLALVASILPANIIVPSQSEFKGK